MTLDVPLLRSHNLRVEMARPTKRICAHVGKLEIVEKFARKPAMEEEYKPGEIVPPIRHLHQHP